ncbi:Theileria-specific sub-telomeric protein, SVSP family, putative [Theileria annulata]|uniref:Theileria-specific sub-telomeric protein, SVSP family, putative n=1 Tax=Theileria annulata TaxID=5874 RepID=Q4UAT4_THEAN|nr:Theileria-specific sub-telomeric protein, SVSP family, putative [Theileria annulata]CAI76067.1 Theileria-specific sub-telomeric protein, SVSP family, putative [Theileria annulata]|eukprot:XP_955543.1 Theileria-specific sub-telomeric protein, SVSP family, putative [Theileria annulata]
MNKCVIYTYIIILILIGYSRCSDKHTDQYLDGQLDDEDDNFDVRVKELENLLDEEDNYDLIEANIESIIEDDDISSGAVDIETGFQHPPHQTYQPQQPQQPGYPEPPPQGPPLPQQYPGYQPQPTPIQATPPSQGPTQPVQHPRPPYQPQPPQPPAQPLPIATPIQHQPQYHSGYQFIPHPQPIPQQPQPQYRPPQQHYIPQHAPISVQPSIQIPQPGYYGAPIRVPIFHGIRHPTQQIIHPQIITPYQTYIPQTIPIPVGQIVSSIPRTIPPYQYPTNILLPTLPIVTTIPYAPIRLMTQQPIVDHPLTVDNKIDESIKEPSVEEEPSKRPKIFKTITLMKKDEKGDLVPMTDEDFRILWSDAQITKYLLKSELEQINCDGECIWKHGNAKYHAKKITHNKVLSSIAIRYRYYFIVLRDLGGLWQQIKRRIPNKTVFYTHDDQNKLVELSDCNYNIDVSSSGAIKYILMACSKCVRVDCRGETIWEKDPKDTYPQVICIDEEINIIVYFDGYLRVYVKKDGVYVPMYTKKNIRGQMN